MFWILLGVFLIGPILAIPFAMAAGKMAPFPEEVLSQPIEIEKAEIFQFRESRRSLVEQ